MDEEDDDLIVTSPLATDAEPDEYDALGAEDPTGFTASAIARQRNRQKRLTDLYAQAEARLRGIPVGPSDKEKWLALSAALGSPTKTGSFGETLGNVSSVLASHQKAKREAEAEREKALIASSLASQQSLLTNETQLDALLMKQLAPSYTYDETRGAFIRKPGPGGGATVVRPEGLPDLPPVRTETVGGRTFIRGPKGQVTPVTPVDAWRPATPEEARSYGASGGQINTTTGEFKPATAGAGKLSGGEREILKAATDLVDTAPNIAATLKQALDLSEKAYDGGLGDLTYKAASLLPGASEAEKATEEMKVLLTGQALEQLKAIFGAAPTEGERKILLDIQGSVTQNRAVRRSIIQRAIQLLEQRRKKAQEDIRRIRSGYYNERSGGAPTKSATPGFRIIAKKAGPVSNVVYTVELNGVQYDIEAPDDATEEQLMAFVQEQAKSARPATPPAVPDIGGPETPTASTFPADKPVLPDPQSGSPPIPEDIEGDMDKLDPEGRRFLTQGSDGFWYDKDNKAFQILDGTLVPVKDPYEKYTDVVVRPLGQGFTLGFGDEIEAAIRSGSPFFGDAYRKERDALRERYAETERDYGGLTFAAEMLGGALTPVGPLSWLKRGSSLAQGAKMGGAFGALTALGTEKEINADTPINMIGGGAAGSAAGVALPWLAGKATDAAGALRSLVSDYAPTTAERGAINAFTGELDGAGGVSMDDIIRGVQKDRAMGVPAVVGDYVPALTDNVVNDPPTAATKELLDTLVNRQLTQKNRVDDQLRTQFGDIDYFEAEDALQRGLRARANAAYDRAYNATDEIDDPKVEQILGLPAVQSFWRNAQEVLDVENQARIANDLEPIQLKELFRFENGPDGTITGVRTDVIPDVRSLDFLKRGMDRAITAGFKQGSLDSVTARALKDTLEPLLKRVDALVPEYAAARRTYKGDIEVIEALERGREALKGSVRPQGEIKFLSDKNTSDAEKTAYRIGLLQAFMPKLEDASTNRNFAREVITPLKNNELLKAVLTADEYRLLQAALQRESRLFEQTSAALGNSKTKSRLSAGQRKDAAAGLENGIIDSGNVFSVGGAVRETLRWLSRMTKSKKRDKVNATLAKVLKAGTDDELMEAFALMNRVAPSQKLRKGAQTQLGIRAAKGLITAIPQAAEGKAPLLVENEGLSPDEEAELRAAKDMLEDDGTGLNNTAAEEAGTGPAVPFDIPRTGIAEVDAIAPRVLMRESAGDPNAVSPAGARGLMQLMPLTQVDPGYNVAPARDNSPEENLRVGTQYLAALYQHYGGDMKLALMAYNWGPGNVDDWLSSGRTATVPSETVDYVTHLLGELLMASNLRWTPDQQAKLKKAIEDVRAREFRKRNPYSVSTPRRNLVGKGYGVVEDLLTPVLKALDPFTRDPVARERQARRDARKFPELVEFALGPEETVDAGRRAMSGDAGAEDWLTLGLTAIPAGLATKPVRGGVRWALRSAPGAKAAKRALEKAKAPAFPELERPSFTSVDTGDALLVQRSDRNAPPIRKNPRAAEAKDLQSLRAILADPEQNVAYQAADEYMRQKFGRGYDLDASKPTTSLGKQAGIGRVYAEAVKNDPAYKSAIFERYGELMPEVVEEAGAQNYDQLLEAAYGRLADEGEEQFATLPLKMTFDHSPGYPTPSAMLRDMLGEGHMTVYRGGDEHRFLKGIDPATGLNPNEKFRAYHDFYGHGIHGNTFRPGGEEIAYAAHSQMLSPLARLALLAETRGQNSFVNYTPVNADILGEMNALQHFLSNPQEMKYIRDQMDYAQRAGLDWPQLPEWDALLTKYDIPDDAKRARLRELGGEMSYAPQEPVLLPPEYVPADTLGGVPEFLKPLIKPGEGEAVTGARGVHFSRADDIVETDPLRFGSGHQGAEYPLVRGQAPPRSYFYVGDEGTIVPERALQSRGFDANAYETELPPLYDSAADPLGLAKLANAYKYSTHAASPLAEFDNLVRDYGYDGYLGGVDGSPAAAVYTPQRVRKIKGKKDRYAEGGPVE